MSTLHARYPILVSPEAYVEMLFGYRLPLDAILVEDDIVRVAKAIIDSTLSGERVELGDGREWVLGFYAALAAAGASGSLRLKRRVVDELASVLAERLSQEDLRVLMSIARRLGLPVEGSRLEIPWIYSERGTVIPRVLVASIPVHSYLSLAKSLEGPEWRLTNSFLLAGRVYLDRARLEGLTVAAMKARMEEYANMLADYARGTALEELGRAAASRLDEGVQYGRFNPSNAPECVKRLEARVASGEASLEEFYTLVAFLANVGAGEDYLADILYSTGAFSRPVAAIAARAILEEARRFRPLKCSVLAEKGICDCEKDLLHDYYSRLRAGSRARGKSRR